jgi:gluconate 5-dehydrogenase
MSLELFNLTGKRVLITGSGRGIGFEIAKGLGQVGAEVIISDIDSKRLDAAVAELQSMAIESHGVIMNVTDEPQIEKTIADIQENIGSIDILFNNAGINLRGPIEEYSFEDWKTVLDINLAGVFLVSKHVVKDMIKRQAGKIINTCSLMSELGRSTTAAYAASKGGVKMLTKAMTVEWAKHNIQINGIGPGYFVSEMTKPLVEDEKFNEWVCGRTHANRWGQLKELVGAAIFLGSDASSFVNGQIIYIDGGFLSTM